MKTSLIRYRVADFLREHQPFDVFSMDDLLAFSGAGRVIFHEDDIHLYRVGETRESLVWVIQQGQVEILDETTEGTQLRDVLVPGDILGLERRADSTKYAQTARTATEVILYAFDLGEFEGLAARYPEAIRFLTAHLSAGARRTKALQAPATRERLLSADERGVWLNAPGRPSATISRRALTCEPGLEVREVARRMSEAGRDAIAVIDAQGILIGTITGADLLDQVSTGAVRSDWPVETIMNSRFTTVPAGQVSRDYMLEMIRRRCRVLAVTTDGSPSTPLRELLTELDLVIDSGRNPMALLREIAVSESISELAYLLDRAKSFVLDGLAGSSVVEWYAQFWSQTNRALVARVSSIAIDELERAGRELPRLRMCRLFLGGAGRGDLIAGPAPEFGIIYDGYSDAGTEPVDRYFETLLAKITAKLQACGLSIVREPVCRSLGDWRAFYSELIRDPIGNGIFASREYFDLQLVDGDEGLVAGLQSIILSEISGSDAFLPVLANDTIANQPPLTFYKGVVIESDGRLRTTLDLEQSVLIPVADAGRVMALGRQDISSPRTLDRLDRAAADMPFYASILHDAAEAWRIAAYHHAIAGLTGQGSGETGRRNKFTRFDQRLLKTAFDSTRRFLELASTLDYGAMQ